MLSVAWSPDAAQIATGDMAGIIWLWDPSTGTPHGVCKGGCAACRRLRSRVLSQASCCAGHSKWITSIAWEPAHRQLPCRRFASGSKDATVKVLPEPCSSSA